MWNLTSRFATSLGASQKVVHRRSNQRLLLLNSLKNRHLSVSYKPGSPSPPLFRNITVIASRSPKETTPEEIISHIQWFPLALDSRQRDPLVVFFLTPSFAHWLLDEDIFLKKALTRLFNLTLQNRNLVRRFHVVAAVVDKLPSPDNRIQSNQVEFALARSCTPPVSDSGFEGLGLLVTSRNDFINEEVVKQPDSTPGSITIKILSKLSSQLSPKAPNLGNPFSIQVPLANTIFHTGLRSTMFGSTWVKSSGFTDVALLEQRPLAHKTITWPWYVPSNFTLSALAVPLTPLTMPRRIKASMGNILRQICDAESKDVPASQELEESVNRYFQVSQQAPRAVLVWALVIPPEALGYVVEQTQMLVKRPNLQSNVNVPHDKASLDDLWMSNDSTRHDIIWSAIKRGARLHKVLSGGGGWGKKAGLLSLDPETSFTEAGTADTSDYGMPFSSLNTSSPLQEIAKPGEYIQFFILTDTEDTNALGKEIDSDCYRAWSVDIGTIPSTMDAMPSQETVDDHAANKPKIEVFERHLGVLSESGVSLELQGRQSLAKWSTKVDVPFSRYSISRIVPPLGSSDTTEVKTDISQSLPPAILDISRNIFTTQMMFLETCLDFQDIRLQQRRDLLQVMEERRQDRILEAIEQLVLGKETVHYSTPIRKISSPTSHMIVGKQSIAGDPRAKEEMEQESSSSGQKIRRVRAKKHRVSIDKGIDSLSGMIDDLLKGF